MSRAADQPHQVNELTLAPTPAQQRLLAETMVRCNEAADAVAGIGFARTLADPDDLASVGRDELARRELPGALRRAAVERAARELRGARRKPRIGRFQALLYGDTVQWPAPDQARLWTVRGRRNVRVEPDRRYGWIRSPLERRAVRLERRAEQLVLVAEDTARNRDE